MSNLKEVQADLNAVKDHLGQEIGANEEARDALIKKVGEAAAALQDLAAAINGLFAERQESLFAALGVDPAAPNSTETPTG